MSRTSAGFPGIVCSGPRRARTSGPTSPGRTVDEAQGAGLDVGLVGGACSGRRTDRLPQRWLGILGAVVDRRDDGRGRYAEPGPRRTRPRRDPGDRQGRLYLRLSDGGQLPNPTRLLRRPGQPGVQGCLERGAQRRAGVQIDSYTYNFDYVGSRTTGNDGEPTPTSPSSSIGPNFSTRPTWTTSRRSRLSTASNRCRHSRRKRLRLLRPRWTSSRP